MKKQEFGRFAALFMALSVLAVLLAPQGVFAHPVADDAATFESSVTAGITPDSGLHFFDSLFDNIGLALTFDKEKKADRALHIAQERLAETEEMIADNKLDAAQISQSQHDRALETVKSSIRSLSRGDSSSALEREIRLEAELEKHEKIIEQVRDGLRVKLKVKGNVSESQLSLVDSLMNLLQNQTGKVKVEIQGEKNSLKLKIRSEEGRSEVEVEQKISELEEKAGLLELRSERASEQIQDAIEELAEAKAKAEGTNLTNLTGFTNLSAVAELISLAEHKLSRAQAAFNSSDFGEAFGQAQAAEMLARNAERLLERSKAAVSIGSDNRGRGSSSSGRGNGSEAREVRVEERTRIQAKVFNSSAEAKVELRFSTTEVEREKILNELLLRLNLSKEMINSTLDMQNESEELRERLRTEIRVREGLAEVRFEFEFPLNATERSAIVDGIFGKVSSLTAADLERALRAEIGADEEREDDEGEREVEIEVEDGTAKIKIEVGESRLRFTLPFTNESALFSEIASRTGLSVDEVKALAKVEMEDDKDKEDADEKRGRGGGREEDDNDEDEDEGENGRNSRGSGSSSGGSGNSGSGGSGSSGSGGKGGRG